MSIPCQEIEHMGRVYRVYFPDSGSPYVRAEHPTIEEKNATKIERLSSNQILMDQRITNLELHRFSERGMNELKRRVFELEKTTKRLEKTTKRKRGYDG